MRKIFIKQLIKNNENKKNYLLINDLGYNVVEPFKKKYPDRFFNAGISEQNMMTIAAGLSSEGFYVFTTTFAPFQTMRCLEQIKVNLGYMKHKVTMVGLASGLILGPLGYTHCCIEDISIMRSIPNVQVLSPADPFESAKSINVFLL